jgi:hypothetical protein
MELPAALCLVRRGKWPQSADTRAGDPNEQSIQCFGNRRTAMTLLRLIVTASREACFMPACHAAAKSDRCKGSRSVSSLLRKRPSRPLLDHSPIGSSGNARHLTLSTRTIVAVTSGDQQSPGLIAGRAGNTRNRSSRASRRPAESCGLLINRRDHVHPGVDRKPLFKSRRGFFRVMADILEPPAERLPIPQRPSVASERCVRRSTSPCSHSTTRPR